MYLQLYYDVPECIDTLTVTGMPYGDGYGNPKFIALVREDKPVIWDEDDYPTFVSYNYIVESKDKNSWTFKNLKPGKRYYFHFLNTGSSGLLYGPRAKGSWSAEEECGENPEENNDEEIIDDADGELAEDSDITDSGDETNDDDIYSDDEPKKEKKSSGCSMTLF